MRADVRIDANGRPELGKSMIRFGKIAREDIDAEVHIYQINVDADPDRVVREFVGGAKSKRYDLPAGNQYAIIVIGDKIAGVASTAPTRLVAPFNVFMNPPEDHSKDFMRVDIPANVPIEGDLKRAIKASLRDK